MDEAEYCGRVGIMRDGKLLAIDTPTALKETAIPGDGMGWQCRTTGQGARHGSEMRGRTAGRAGRRSPEDHQQEGDDEKESAGSLKKGGLKVIVWKRENLPWKMSSFHWHVEMSKMMGRPATRHEERKDQIIDAALEVFSQKGYDGTTNHLIAHAAGLNSAALIYHYFPARPSCLKPAWNASRRWRSFNVS